MATSIPCPGGHFVDSSATRVPSGYSHGSTTSTCARSAGLTLSLSTKIGPSTARSSRAMPAGDVVAEELALLLREQLAQRARAGDGLGHGGRRHGALSSNAEHDVATRHRVDLDHEVR